MYETTVPGVPVYVVAQTVFTILRSLPPTVKETAEKLSESNNSTPLSKLAAQEIVTTVPDNNVLFNDHVNVIVTGNVDPEKDI